MKLNNKDLWKILLANGVHIKSESNVGSEKLCLLRLEKKKGFGGILRKELILIWYNKAFLKVLLGVGVYIKSKCNAGSEKRCILQLEKTALGGIRRKELILK